jgi:acyl dehydratase
MSDTPAHTITLDAAWFENFTFDDIDIGHSARLVRTLTLDDIQAFAAVSGDTNPAHLDPAYANATLFHGVIGHGMWGGALISSVLGTTFPGPGTIYLEQNLHFSRPVRIGDTLTVSVTCTAKHAEKKTIDLDCTLVNQKGERVLYGVAHVMAPAEKLRMQRIQAPHISVFDPEQRHANLLALGATLEAVRCGVVHPCDADSLQGAMDAHRAGLIHAVLIAPEKKLRALALDAGIDWAQDYRCAAQPCRCRTRRANGGEQTAGGLDERQLAHRRVDSRRGHAAWPAHGASHVARVSLRDACLPQAAVHHRCRAEYRAQSVRKGRHRAKRDFVCANHGRG